MNIDLFLKATDH